MNRNLWLLAICQGLFLTNNVTFIAINGLVGWSLAPLGWMATLPVMGYVVGGALSTGLVAKTQARYGRRTSFQLGLAVAVASALLCGYAAYSKNFWLLVAATVIAGYYNANAQLYRFAAAELALPAFREKAISWVMAGGLLGAVAGPNLAAGTRNLTEVPFAGAYLALAGVALLAMALLAFIQFPPAESGGGHGRRAGPPQARPAPSGGSEVREATSVGASFFHGASCQALTQLTVSISSPTPTMMRKAQNTGATGGCSPTKSFKPLTSPSRLWVRYSEASLGMAIS